ncbi:MAG TPA: DUF3107 family protein [Acidimicrobiia bacterium]
MRVRIGVADSAKLIELDVDDLKAFKKSMVDAVKSGEVAWFTDTKGREVGVPAVRISYVEMETEDTDHRVGFGTGG